MSTLDRGHWLKKFKFLLPEALYNWLILKFIKLPLVEKSDLVIKLAQTREELEEAFDFIYQQRTNNKERGRTLRLRISKYQLTPGSNIIIAKQGDKIVGSLSLFVDSCLGIPSDEAWDLHQFKLKHPRIVEASHLTLDKRFSNGDLVFQLFKCALYYIKNNLRAQTLVMSMKENTSSLYESIFKFKRVGELLKKHHPFYHHDICEFFYLDLDSYHDEMKSFYGPWQRANNLFYFLYKILPPRCFRYPQESYFKSVHMIWSSQTFEHFCKSNLVDLEKLDQQDIFYLKNLYHFDHFCNQFDNLSTPVNRDHLRMLAYLPGQIFNIDRAGGPLIQKVQITSLNVSRKGVAIETAQKLNPADRHLLRLQISPRKKVDLVVKPCYHNNKVVGVKLLAPNKEWDQYIDFLEKDFKPEEPQAA